MVSPQRETSCSKMITSSHSTSENGNGKSGRLRLGKDPAKTYFLRLCLVSGRKLDMESFGNILKTSGWKIAKEADILRSCWRRSNSTSRRLPTTSECVPQNYRNRIIFMAIINELEVTDNPHIHDRLRIQQAQGVRDCAARFRPGYWIFVYPGSEKTWSYDMWEAENPNGNWDSKALKILQKF